MVPAQLTRELPTVLADRDAAASTSRIEDAAIQCELADMLYSSPWSVATDLLVTLAAIGLLSLAFDTPIFPGWGVPIIIAGLTGGIASGYTARTAGGAFVIESVPNQGTVVRVILPPGRVVSPTPTPRRANAAA